MKNNLFLLLTFTCLSSILYGQKNEKDKDTWRIDEARTYSPSLDDITYYKTQTLPFKNVIVFDKRFDSSKAGYTASGNKFVRIVPKESWSTILNNYFKKNLDPNSSHSLVIVIKSFWMQRGVIEELISKKVVKKEPGLSDLGGNCKSALDVYVQSDTTYQALFQLDTTFLSLVSNFNRNRLENFFFLPFDSVARKIATIDLNDMLSRKRKLSSTEINNYYSGRFNVPVLNQSGIKQGIFYTFNDFKNNNPVPASLNFREGRLTDELYITGNGSETLVADYWGFCNDKGELYIRAGFNAFKAVRQQNAFELYGAKYVSNYRNYYGQGSLNISSYNLDNKILQVNMDNGKLY